MSAQATPAPELQTPNELDPYLTVRPPADDLRARWLARHPRRILSPDELLDRVVATSPWLASHAIKGQTSFPTVHAVRRARTLVDVEADWIKASFPEWSKGRFVTLTIHQGTLRERLLERHQRWTAVVDKWAREPICQYRVIDEHLSGTSHLHLLLFGASDVGDDILRAAWGKVAASIDIKPLTQARLYYAAVRYVQRGERDVIGPWPRCTTPIAEPEENALQREMKVLRRAGRHPGRPVRELVDALSWLLCVLGTDESYLVSDLRRAIAGQEFSFKTLCRAKRMLDVTCRKRGRREWLWSLSPVVNCGDDLRAA